MGKNNLNIKFIYLILCFLISSCNRDNQKPYSLMKVGPQSDGSILVPSNQLLRPAGFQVSFPGRPVDMALTTDGKFLVVKNKNDLDLIRLADRKVMQSLPYERSGASFTGICLSPDGKSIYVTDADNRICIAGFDRNKVMQWKEPVILPSADGDSPVPGGVALNREGDKLYVTLSRNNSLAVIDLYDKSVNEIGVGIAPYGVVYATPSKVYVSNWGGRRPLKGESSYNTSGSKVLVDPLTGIANNGSVSVVDLNSRKEVKNIEVGLHPSGMVLSPDGKKLYVACANSDVIAVINTDSDEVIDNISVHRQKGILFGSSPNALAISPDGEYLYVASGTENAVCVIKTGTPSAILGYIPTGWYPGSVVT